MGDSAQFLLPDAQGSAARQADVSETEVQMRLHAKLAQLVGHVLEGIALLLCARETDPLRDPAGIGHKLLARDRFHDHAFCAAERLHVHHSLSLDLSCLYSPRYPGDGHLSYWPAPRYESIAAPVLIPRKKRSTSRFSLGA